ncbi:MAG: hypothetical protein ACRC1M_08625 [Methanobacteriaceae archaeon]
MQKINKSDVIKGTVQTATSGTVGTDYTVDVTVPGISTLDVSKLKFAVSGGSIFVVQSQTIPVGNKVTIAYRSLNSNWSTARTIYWEYSNY